MFNKTQLDRIEKKLDSFRGDYVRDYVRLAEHLYTIYDILKPVSHAKASKKRGRPAKKVTTKKK